MYCRNCGNEVSENAEICLSCGVRPLLEKNFCQNCGKETQSNQELCVKCGVLLKSQATDGFIPGSGKKARMNPWEGFVAAFSKYATFRGRARRMEYWGFGLFELVFAVAALILDGAGGSGGALYALTTLVFLIPGISVTVRRLHDVGKSAWFGLILIIPIVGWIWYLVVVLQDGDFQVNKYGPSPKYS